MCWLTFYNFLVRNYMSRMQEKMLQKNFVYRRDQRGLRSSSYITTGFVNNKVYIKECLQKRLFPFFKKHEVSTFSGQILPLAITVKRLLSGTKQIKFNLCQRRLNLQTVLNSAKLNGIGLL